MLWDETFSMTFYDRNEEVTIVSKTLSMNILTFSKGGSTIITTVLQTMNVEGSFEDVTAYRNGLDREFTHIVKGRFKFYNHK